MDESDIEQVAELLNHDLLSTSYLTSAYWVEEMIAAFPEVEAAKVQLETQHAAFAFFI